jgi:CRP-like cAMP-binding protein/Fe-S-cluster-containing hydrogenase component 2
VNTRAPTSGGPSGFGPSNDGRLDALGALAEKAESEVMSCIGCNDCMLACPLTEARNVTIAEINAAVHLPLITNPNVITFVTACTQCRQCVPACPADLSRADMVLFNKMKVEDTVPDHTLMLQVGRGVVPSPWTLDGLASTLKDLPLFAGLVPQDLRRLLLKMTLRQLAPGEVLCREGEFHERLYIVLSGTIEQWSSGARGEQYRILALGPGSFFGEMAIMADQPEAFTVMASTIAVVIEIPKAAVVRMMNQCKAFQGTMDELYRRRALWTYARKPSGLGGLPEQAIQELLVNADLAVVKPGDVVCREGERPRDVFLVRSGFFRVSRRIASDGIAGAGPATGGPASSVAAPSGAERVVTYFREGDLFGALPLLLGERVHSLTVMATSRAEIIRIPGADLFAMLGRYPQAQQALTQGALEVERVARSPALGKIKAPSPQQQATIQALSVDVLVDMGVAKGREVLVVDQNKCTFCNNCIDACARRHKYSRLQLRGLQVENLMFPTACRHCDDPVCLLCSVNGIVRLPTGEITIVDDNCIGCGACADRCPYGNISMHPIEPPKRGFFVNLIDFLKGGVTQRAALAEIDPKAARKAVKCDLCAGYNDYACVTACPVGAAFRIDPASALGSDDVNIGLDMKHTKLG